jgi:CDP-diglyceride synthetase
MVNAFLKKNGKETRFLTISSHVMLLLGLIQWFVGVWGLKLIQTLGMKEAMGNAAARFFSVEHPLTMIIAIALITMGGVSVKKEKDNAKWFYLVALLLILARIPWPFMEPGIARGLFPGMGA